MKHQESVKSVRVAMDLIEELADNQPMKAVTLAERLDMPRSTVYDYLRTLSGEGYIGGEEGQYSLTHRFLSISGRVRSKSILYRTARTELRDLAKKTGAHANLVVEERGFGVVLSTMSGENTFNALTHDGTYFYLHAAASGKAILANYPDEQVDAILDRRGLVAMTDKTITDRKELKTDLEATVQRDYSIDSGEIVNGMRGIGSSILNLTNGEVVGAISLYMPVNRPDWEELADDLLEVSNIIEVELAELL